MALDHEFAQPLDDLANDLDENVRKLRDHLERDMGQYITQKGDPRTNLIDQKIGMTWALPAGEQYAAYKMMDACRRGGYVMHYAERQSNTSVSEYLESCLMLDFDIVQTVPTTFIDNIVLRRLCGVIVSVVRASLEFPSAPNSFHIVCLKKPKPHPHENGFKDGFHLNVYLKMNVGVRCEICRVLEERFKPILDAVGVGPSPNTGVVTAAAVPAAPPVSVAPRVCTVTFDHASATVPVLLTGSCKPTKNIAYAIENIYKVDLDGAEESYSLNVVPVLEYGPACLVGEFSMIYEFPEGFVKKPTYQPRSALLQMVKERADSRIVANTDCDEFYQTESHHLESVEIQIQYLCRDNPQASVICALLEILSAKYYEEYDPWMKVMFALGNTNKIYRPAALKFSQKSAKFNRQKFDQVWDDAIRGGGGTRLTHASLRYWARVCNPIQYEKIIQSSFDAKLKKYVTIGQGDIRAAMISDILFTQLKERYRCDRLPGSKQMVWFEFITEHEKHRPGEVFKWRMTECPHNLHTYISDEFSVYLLQYKEQLISRARFARNKAETMYFKKTIMNFQRAILRLWDPPFKASIARDAESRLDDPGFAKTLNSEPDIIGVGNGILRLDKKCELITGFHEHPVSFFTEVEWEPYDPTNTYVQQLEKVISDIIPEPDAREYLMCYFSTGLCAKTKAALFLFLFGGGGNGKSVLMEQLLSAIGNQYGKKLDSSIFTTHRQASGPDSAVMQMKDARLGYTSEPDASAAINTSFLKEITGGENISRSEKYGLQENWQCVCTITFVTNHQPQIETYDEGTWRRIISYTCQTKFKDNPDPANPRERKKDPSLEQIKGSMPHRMAMLSILTHYYEILQEKYGGHMGRIQSPTIIACTNELRNRNDIINKFIMEHLVPDAPQATPVAPQAVAPEATVAPAVPDSPPKGINLDDIIAEFNKWIARRQRTNMSTRDIRDYFLNSRIAGSLVRVGPTDNYVLPGYRMI